MFRIFADTILDRFLAVEAQRGHAADGTAYLLSWTRDPTRLSSPDGRKHRAGIEIGGTVCHAVPSAIPDRFKSSIEYLQNFDRASKFQIRRSC